MESGDELGKEIFIHPRLILLLRMPLGPKCYKMENGSFLYFRNEFSYQNNPQLQWNLIFLGSPSNNYYYASIHSISLCSRSLLNVSSIVLITTL